MSPASKINILKDRSLMMRQSRSFFYERGFLEVDCPALAKAAPIDAYIDVMEVDLKTEGVGYLHTSPEYCMKRLLSVGIGDIFYLGHVFREEEQGNVHNPEFTMAEWYRVGLPFESMIREAIEFIQLFLGSLDFQLLTYREAIKRYAHFDHLQTSLEELKTIASTYDLLPASHEDLDRDSILQLIMSFCVEPNFPKNSLTIIYDYPASQAALAKTYRTDDEEVAKRFEIYYHTIELANGFEELTDPEVQRVRFLEANEKRRAMGKPPLKLDENFLKALENGLPPCCGVAVGFDRLLMLRHHQETISDVMPFSWAEI